MVVETTLSKGNSLTLNSIFPERTDHENPLLEFIVVGHMVEPVRSSSVLATIHA